MDRFVDQLAEWLEPAGTAGGPTKSFTIGPGEELHEVSQRLAQGGVVRNPLLLRLLLRYHGLDREVRAGRYSLSSDVSLSELVRTLVVGQIELVRVTVPEGWRAEEIAALLEKTHVASGEEFLSLVHTPGHPPLTTRMVAPSLEGFLFPDTYLVPRDFGARAFLDLMLQTFEAKVRSEQVTPSVGGVSPSSGLHPTLSFYDQVVLASVVEREAKIPEERSPIAATFLNRLRDEMYLAADPTVQYALAPAFLPAPPWGYWKRELTTEDLRVSSPYNTYTVRGLPPTPIANPGLAALAAVMNPEPGPYRFFVAKSDGSHAFGVTFEEHMSNVSRYQGER